MKKINFKYVISYSIVGILFGACFPLGALTLEFLLKGYTFSIESIIIAHNNNKLLFMIDSAPLFLGIFALIGGIIRGKASCVTTNLQELLKVIQKENSTLNKNSIKLLKETEHLNSNTDIEKKELTSLTNNCSLMKNNMSGVIDNIRNQTASIEEISATVSELTSQMTNISDKTEETKKIATNTSNILDQSEEFINNSVNTMNKLNEDIGHIYSISESFIDLTEKITNISSLIASLSQKTNLLSLNAAIEASRAGEAGKGFSVVANEIKVLADHSHESVNKIEAISQEIQTHSLKMLEMTGVARTGITRSSQKMADLKNNQFEILHNINITNENMFNVASLLESQKISMGEIEAVMINITENNINIETSSVTQLEEEQEISKTVDSIFEVQNNTYDISCTLSDVSVDLSNISNDLVHILNKTK